MKSLDDKVIVITGASSGIGLCTALLAAEQADFADVEGVGSLWARHVRQRLTGLVTG